jgi:hypothetical protein
LTSFFALVLKLILLIGISGICSFARAVKSPNDVPVGPLPKTMEDKLINRNIEISDWFDGVAEGLDLFLVGEKVTRTRNQSRITVEHTTYSMEHRSIREHFSIGIYPRLPNLEKYWALKFTNYDENEERRNIKNNYISRSARRDNYGATVAWYRKLGKVRTSFEPRIELRDPIRISHSLNFSSISTFGKYEFNPKLEFYTSASKGVGFFEAFNINYFIKKRWTLTLINEGDYLDFTRTYTVNNGFSLGNNLTNKKTLSYGFIVTSNNRPNYHLDSYVASISYNEIIYKKIFDFTVTPYLEFLRAKSFKGQVGGVLNLRLQF